MYNSGLSDSNGKEILEGDVYVTDYSGSNEKYLVTFQYGAFCGGRSRLDSMPIAWRTCEDDPDDIVPDDWMSHITVIGNIYDNPELMNDE